MTVTIEPATLSTATYITANIRDQDRKEIEPLLNAMTLQALAGYTFYETPRTSWIARYNNQPCVFFGFTVSPFILPSVASIYLWGTKHTKRCIPEISRFGVREWPEICRLNNIRRLECRTADGHEASTWLEHIGAKHVAPLQGFGKGGETYHLYEWVL